jgi:16S rRNA (adenine1518-N6/adenine1519-N6)-dimethyltransferase
MKLSEMRELLGARNIQLTKSLGQNFLHDGNQLRRIAAAGEVSAGDRVLEVGPGLGPLTAMLLSSGARLLAIEKDKRLVEVLQERFAAEMGAGQLQLVHADALEWLQTNAVDWSGWKLVANLPYSVASPILVELALAAAPPSRLVATLQAEVADRLQAEPGTGDYGLLTVLVGLHYRAAGTFRIPASCFFPPPDVESACIAMVRRETPLVEPSLAPAYAKVAKLAFSQRRKMMMKLLKQNFPTEALQAAYGTLGLDPAVRAEQVTIEQFSGLTCRLFGP